MPSLDLSQGPACDKTTTSCLYRPATADMAAGHHHLTIAKATFAASLLRPDVTKISRDEVPQFHALFETATGKCSPLNIQKCKEWLVTNILPSPQRTSAFARYLTVFTKHVQSHDCSFARRRLHILYLTNDLLHHEKYHAQETHFSQAIQPRLVEMVRGVDKPRVRRRLEDLLSLWQEYFDSELISQARAVLNDPTAATNDPTVASEPTKDLPFIMPSTHGDPSLPFYELPAGNFMPHIIPNKPIPMRSDSIRPLQFALGPADESLVNAVRDFLKDVEGIDNEFGRLDDTVQFDEIGQISYKDEAGGMLGETYYGWSRAFCEKMKFRGKPDDRSNSTSRSPSRSPRKRRRYSNSSRSSRSYSRSRSRSSPGFRRDNSRSPVRASFFLPIKPQTNAPFQRHQPPPAHQHLQLQPPHPPQSQFYPAMQPPPPFATGNKGIHPPRPPNWQGSWPPPPPPPPPPGMMNPFPPPGFGRQNPGPPPGPRGGFHGYR